jgi:hypothetical protein
MADAAGSALVAFLSLASGNNQLSSFTRFVLKLLAAEALVRGIFETAAAFAALAVYNYDSATNHFTAAAGFFKVAQQNYSAATASGGRGGRSGSRGGGSESGMLEQAPPPGPPTQYVINVDGIIVGTDENSIGRWIAENLNKVRRDNVRLR